MNKGSFHRLLPYAFNQIVVVMGSKFTHNYKFFLMLDAVVTHLLVIWFSEKMWNIFWGIIVLRMLVNVEMVYYLVHGLMATTSVPLKTTLSRDTWGDYFCEIVILSVLSHFWRMGFWLHLQVNNNTMSLGFKYRPKHPPPLQYPKFHGQVHISL